MLLKDATDWAEALRNKKISFGELIQQIRKTIDVQNPLLNAVVAIDYAQAQQEYEAQLATGKLADSLFAGVPIPLKILGQSKAGWADTNGSRLFADAIATTSNHFVEKMEALGLIPLGQTNAPEFGFKNITDPVLFGDTRNPWDATRYPGGSSGGAAAAVASGMFPLAAASDGGGSIRIPASFSGLIGLKPTRGTMPVGPDGWRGWQGASINFALTVSVRDTAAFFYGMRGTEHSAPYQAPKPEWTHTPNNRRLPSRPLKIAFTTQSPVGSPISPEAVAAVQQAVARLTAAGHQVEEVAYPLDGEAIIRSYYRMNGAETAAMFANIQRGFGRKIAQEEVELMTWAIWQYGEKISAASYVNSLAVWDQAAAAMATFHDKYDLFLTPTTGQPAPLIGQELVSASLLLELSAMKERTEAQGAELIYRMFEKSLALSPFTQLANLTGQPAISLPTHLTEEGLPLGIQLMADRGREDLLLGIGELFENEGAFILPSAWR